MKTITVNVAEDFSPTPGPRSPDEGDWSGEEFLESVLKSKFSQAVSENAILVIDLDGAAGYATSFLEAAFGGLARIHSPDLVRKTLRFKCNDEPYLEDEIISYIDEANDQ